MDKIFLLILTILPPLLILVYIVQSDKFPEPKKTIILAFFLGVLVSMPAPYLNSLFPFQLEDTALAVATAGFVEEPLKFLILYLFFSKRKEFNEPIDGIVYAVCISLGFATIENISYVYFVYADDPFHTAIVRGLLAIPLHAFCGIIMGFYLGMHVFKKTPNYLYFSLLFPIALHSSYNFFLMLNFFLTILILIIGFIASRKLLKKLKQEQHSKMMEEETKIN